MFQSQLSTPEENGHRPLTIKPSFVIRPRPAASAMVEAEQARLVQQLLVLGQQHARVLALLRALEERRHALARAAHRLFVADAGEAHFRKSSTSRRGGSSATAISFSIARPHPGQQNWRNCGCGSMKRFGSPTIGFDASIGRSLRTQPSL